MEVMDQLPFLHLSGYFIRTHHHHVVFHFYGVFYCCCEHFLGLNKETTKLRSVIHKSPIFESLSKTLLNSSHTFWGFLNFLGLRARVKLPWLFLGDILDS